MTTAELRVLEARMDMLNAMLLDLIDQVRHTQVPSGTDQGPRAATDLSGSPRPSGFCLGGCDLVR
jgi:hypothetical protein